MCLVGSFRMFSRLVGVFCCFYSWLFFFGGPRPIFLDPETIGPGLCQAVFQLLPV